MRLYLYILKEYLKYVIGTVVLTVFLFVLFDFIHKTTKYFAEYNPKGEHILQYYLFQIPAQAVQALPIAGLLGSVICMILLSRTNEITAMRAAGMGPLKLALPLAFGGMLLSVMSLATGELVLPRMAKKVHYVQKVLIEGEDSEEFDVGDRWLKSDQKLITFGEFDPLLKTLSFVKILEVRPNFRPVTSIEATFARFVEETKEWMLLGIKKVYFKRNGTIDRIEDIDTLTMEIPIEPKKLKKDRRKPNELGLGELREAIARGERSGIDALPYQVDYHGKLAYPFAALVVSLIGLKFGYKSERATETAKGVLLAFFIGISYWFILSAGRALALRGDLHPFVSAWMPNVIILGAVFFDTLRSRRQ